MENNHSYPISDIQQMFVKVENNDWIISVAFWNLIKKLGV